MGTDTIILLHLKYKVVNVSIEHQYFYNVDIINSLKGKKKNYQELLFFVLIVSSPLLLGEEVG